MIIYPAIDIFEGKTVRLYKGDYGSMTVYDVTPEEAAERFAEAGAERIHTVDLEGASLGTNPNFELIVRIKKQTGLFVQTGGGIRNEAAVDRYLEAGVDRVILGTAAAEDPAFLGRMTSRYGERIAVGADLRDGFVAVKGWKETTGISAETFFRRLELLGVRCVICTDISRDGAMKGANSELYRSLSEKFNIEIIASGGVSSLEDVTALRSLGIGGAIIGKAYYTGAVDLAAAIEAAK